MDREYDVVFTWVDDAFPGYLESLNEYSTDKRDLNPNRTRDNLDLIRYAMRSVARYLPEARRIYLFTCRPQVPTWLNTDHPKIRLVHHDEVISRDDLPTFSSFAIVSHLHLLPDLTQRFVYFEDDFLANSPNLLNALSDDDGQPVVHFGRHWIAPAAKLNTKTSSPWNLALANADGLLSERFRPGPRRQAIHGPQLFDRDIWAAAIADFPDVFKATRKARFRAGNGIPPEQFIPHYAVETGQAELAPMKQARKVEGYVSLENFLPWTWMQLKTVERRNPSSIALNDSFGDNPNTRVERLVKRWLQLRFPDPAPWENDAAQ